MSNGKIFDWESVETESFQESKIRVKVVDGENMQLIWAEFQPGSRYELHSHEREQFSFMVSGRMKLTLGDEPVVFFDVYSPPAEEFRREA